MKLKSMAMALGLLSLPAQAQTQEFDCQVDRVGQESMIVTAKARPDGFAMLTLWATPSDAATVRASVEELRTETLPGLFTRVVTFTGPRGGLLTIHPDEYRFSREESDFPLLAALQNPEALGIEGYRDVGCRVVGR